MKVPTTLDSHDTDVSIQTQIWVCVLHQNPASFPPLPVYVKNTHYNSNYLQIMLIWISVLYKDSHAYLFLRL